MIKTRSKEDIFHDIEQRKRLDNYLSHSVTANYTFTDNDKIGLLYVTTSTNVITVTLPTAADNKYREIGVKKIDSAFDSSGSTSKITLDGEGAETINGQVIIDIEVQYCGVVVKSDGSNWHVIRMIGDCELRKISGTYELVYNNFLTGTTDNDTITNVSHGVAFTKIIEWHGDVQVSGSTLRLQWDAFSAADANYSMWFGLYNTYFSFSNVGTLLKQQTYRISYNYYV